MDKEQNHPGANNKLNLLSFERTSPMWMNQYLMLKPKKTNFLLLSQKPLYLWLLADMLNWHAKEAEGHHTFVPFTSEIKQNQTNPTNHTFAY